LKTYKLGNKGVTINSVPYKPGADIDESVLPMTYDKEGKKVLDKKAMIKMGISVKEVPGNKNK